MARMIYVSWNGIETFSVMHPLEKKILNLVTGQDVLSADESVVVGVSAGPDSMALLNVLASLENDLPLKITAVYVNHGLRPEETEAEAELVKQTATKLGASFEVVWVDVEGEAAANKKSLEHMARDLRYQVFDQVAQESGADKILVAHTADDQAEEIVIRMLRGAGRGGLSGMKMVRDGKIIRPLLTTTKDEVLAYLEARKISFLEDSSNQDLRFLRNQVRLEILPFLEKYNPGIRNTLRRNAAILQDEEDLLAKVADRYWQEVALVEEDEQGLPMVTMESWKVKELHPAMQRRVAETMLITMQAKPDSRQIEQFLDLVRQGQGGAQLHFSKGLRIRKQKGRLICSYPQGKGAGRGDLS